MNARDLNVDDLCHPEIEWRWPAATPGSSLFRGHEAVTRGLEQWAESWEALQMDPYRRFVAGDRPR